MSTSIFRVRKEAALRLWQVSVLGSGEVSGEPSLAGMFVWDRLPGIGALCKVFVLSVVLTLALASAAFAQLVPTLSINDVTVTEGDTGTTNATFTVTRSGGTTLVSTVNFATANDTATQPSDYASTSGPLTFAAGETTKTVTVPVNGDTEDEADQKFFVDLSTAVNATISKGRGVGTIIDDDDTPQANDDGSAANPITLLEDDPNGVTTNVLANDTGLGDTPITVKVTTTPSKGTATVNADKTITYKPKANENGPDTYRYTVTDSDGQTSTATVYLQITAVNDAPQASDDSKTTPEDQSLTFPAGHLTANDSPGPNESGQSLSVTRVSGATNGTVSLQNGQITFTSNQNYHGSASFSYTVCDTGTPQECTTATVSVNVAAVNDPPDAKDDSYGVTEDDTLSVPAPGVLGNDSDVESNSLTPEVVSGPRNGELTLDRDGSLTYVPTANYSGSDSFTYRVSDGNGGTATATVNIDVSGVNDPPSAENDQATTDEDTPAIIDVKANDSPGPNEANQQTLTVTGVTNPLNGEAEVVASGPDAGKVRYTPGANFNGTDTFPYTVCDSGSPQQCATAVVTVTVNSVNDRPVAKNDTGNTVEDNQISVDVLANDTDADGNNTLDPASVQIVSEPANGTATVNPNGTITYMSNGDYNGRDSFEYTVCDNATPRACSEPAAVSMTVEAINDPPRLSDDERTTAEDGPLTFLASELLENDSAGPNEPGQSLTLTQVANATGGTVSLDNGQITFTPRADYNGPASFTYTGCDDGNPGKCATATVNVNVTADNDAPVARDGDRFTDEDQPLKIQAPGVLFNDTDVDGDRLTASIERSAQHGRVTLDADGSFTYTPDENYNGTDSFTYTVSDGNGGSDTGEVRIVVRSVNDAPNAAGDEITTDEDSLAEVNVLSNDTDADGDTLSVSDFSQPQNGEVVCAPDGTCTYTPSRDFNGPDSFTYRISDGHGGNVTARVSVTVDGVNDAPQALADTYNTGEDELLTINAPGVLGNDTDAEDDPLTAELMSGPQNGELNLNADGSFTYNPHADFNGTDTFDYRVSNGNGGTDTTTVRISVGAANDAPVAVKDAATTDEDQPVDINVLVNDSDPEGDDLSVVGFTQPRFGKAECTPQGICTYTPPPDFNGTDTFTYTVSDGAGGESGTTVTVTIRAVNDAPVAGDSDVFTEEDERIAVEAPGALGDDTDRDGNPLSAAVEQETRHGELSLNPDGSYVYTPDENYNGADSFTYTVSDGNGGSDTGEVRITVRPVNDAPDAVDDEVTLDEDASREIDVLTNDRDADGDTLTLTDFAQPEHGKVSCMENGVCEYEPDANYNGDDSFTYEIGDGGGAPTNATVSITVTGVNDAPNVSDDEKTVEEDATLSFPASDLTANDSAGPNEAEQSLTLTQVANATGGTVSLDNGQITFTPRADYNGPASFTYTGCDDGNPGKCATATVNVNVTAGNDAPENTVPGVQSTDDTAALVFSGENGISISDDSGASGEARVTLSVSDGALSLGSTDGLTFAEGDGADDRTTTFTGSISSINAALDGLRYQPGGYHGMDTLTVTTNDLGNTGTGGPKSDEDTVEITVRDTTAPDVPSVDLTAGSDSGRSDTDNATRDTKPVLNGRAEPNTMVRLYDGEALIVEITADDNGDWTFKVTNELSEGVHRITATATDAAGNFSSRSEPLDITVDTTAPDTFIDRSPPNPTNQRDTVRFYSSSEQGTSFECSFDGVAFEPCDSPKEYNNLSDGEHTFRVRAVDEAGNTDQSPASRTFVVDTERPAVSLTAPENGALVRGEITLSANVSDENGVRNVVFLIDGQVFDSDMSVPYAPTWDSSLVSDGEHTITVRAYDEAGNVAESGTHTIRIDNTAPDTFIDSSPKELTKDRAVTFEFSSLGENVTFECSLDEGAFEPCETSKQYPDLSDGEHTFRVRTVDEAGNTDQSPAERTFVVDTQKPGAPRITSPSIGSLIDNSFTITGTAEPKSTVRLYEGETLVATVSTDENGDWSVALTGVSEGGYTYTARATDEAANTSADSEPLELNIDTTAPDTVITSDPGNPTKSASAAIEFRSTEENSTFECKLDGAAYRPCESPQEYTSLADGEHVFLVRSVDAAGNADRSPASRTFVIDTMAPDAPEISTPTEVSTDNDGDVTVSGTAEPGSRVELLENGDVVGTATADETGKWSIDLTDVTEGSHTYTARATDEAGNTSATSGGRTINVDSGAPEVTRVVPAEDTTGVPINTNIQAVLSEPIDESTLDGSSFTLVKEGSNEPVPASVSYDPATGTITLNSDPDLDFESVYTATIKSGPNGVKDRGGTPLAEDIVWRFTTAQAPDTQAPDAPGVDLAAASDTGRSDTDNTTSDTTPVITGNAEPSSRVELGVGGDPVGATSAVEPGSYSFTFLEALPEGTYRITATATDAAGNASPASEALEITVDITPADTMITGSPAALTNETRASFESASPDEENATFECSLDGGPFEPCESLKEYTGLSDGEHVFRVRSVDTAGNVDPGPAERRFTVDTRAPSAPEITSPADGARRSSNFTVSGTAERNSTVRLYEGANIVETATADENGDWSVSFMGVSDGAHTYTVRATDKAGNASEASGELTVNVDTGAPDTIITRSPDALTNQTTVRFEFTSPDEKNVTFECSFDGGAFEACENGQHYQNFSDGEHTFRVRAVDEAENADLSPASRTFVLDTESPTARLTSPPDGAFVRDEVTIGVETSDNTGVGRTEFVIDILVNGKVVNSDRSFPYETTWDSNLVSDGEHTITVRVYDEAGNVAESQTHTIRVDNTAPDTTIETSPAALTNGRDARIEFSSSERSATFECSIDDGPYAACGSPTEYTGFSDGEHVFRVRAVDESGNMDRSPAERRFMIDSTAPEAPTITSPANDLADNDGNFTISGTVEPGSRVTLYEGDQLVETATAGVNGFWSVDLRDVAEGAHVYHARASDEASNVSESSEERRVRVDSQAPSAPTVDLDAASDTGFSDTDDLTRVDRPTFRGRAEPNSTIRLYEGDRFLGTGTVAESDHYWFAVGEPLSEGEHRITATDTDAAGNTSDSSEALSVVVDRQAPDTFIDSSLKNLTSETMAAFGVSSNEQYTSFECSLDEGPFERCSSPKDYSELSDGQHTFEVRAIDAAGNADPTPARRNWTVDATAPRVIKVTPTGTKVFLTTNVVARFSEAMNRTTLSGVTVRLVKKGTTRAVAATFSYSAPNRVVLNPKRNLVRGATYKVTIVSGASGAKDLAGNALASSVSWTFKVRA